MDALVGKHVRLEPLAMSHVDALVLAVSESRDAYRWTWVPGGTDEMAAYVETALDRRDAGLAEPFATVWDGRVVGSTRFVLERWKGNDDAGGTPDACEIGYTWLAASAQRTVVNTEAKLLMLTHAFETWHVHRVSLRTDARNEASRAAIERIGAKQDGVLRAFEAGVDGTVRDTVWFSILRDEWPAAKARLQGMIG